MAAILNLRSAGPPNDHSCGFWQEDFQGFNQSEYVIGPGSHVEFPIYTKNTNLVEDHPMNRYGKFGWNLFSGFREEELNVKS
jgi:hypothetical protein